MYDLATALALVLVVEGLAYALFPELMRRAMASLLALEPRVVRQAGLAAAVMGVVIVWLIRG
ncbi:MAG: DUF2065 domain-containing protein [Alphaproteobacteria bacterium]